MTTIPGAAGAAQLVRAGAGLPLTAKVGDVLFTGDSLRTDKGTVSFLYCPDKSSQTLGPNGDVTFEEKQLRIKSGQVSDKKTVAVCLLPEMERAPAAGPEHYGASLTRALKPPEERRATFDARLQALPEGQQKSLLAELEPIDKELSADPKNAPARIARAAVLQKYNFSPDAAEEYNRLATDMRDAVWARALVHQIEGARGPEDVAAAPQGKTYALLVGISEYQRLDKTEWLYFAHRDAITFQQHLKSARGGSLPDEDIMVLTNEKATTAAIRNAIHTFLKTKAGKNDTVILSIAAHGVVDPIANRAAYIVTHDSDPQDLKTTALPMAEIQALMEEQLTHVARVLVYVDVCRAGTIGTIKSNKVNYVLESLFRRETEGQILGFMASRSEEYSWEGQNFGGGHGAFTYFLLKGLNGEADANGDEIVDADEIIHYVQQKVREGTLKQQNPRESGSFKNDMLMAEVKRPGIQLTDWTPIQVARARRRSLGTPDIQTGQKPAPRTKRDTAIEAELDLFDDAIENGRILPETPGSAFFPLARLKRLLPPDKYLLEENKLRVALENQGQQVLLRYLTGDQAPQTRSDFARGALYFQAARQLTPESVLLESKESFCRGRALIFDKRYREASDPLERAVRLDPGGAYSYNALGILYLEQADYPRAVLAFRDATQRAPRWAYPMHNLALAYTEMGNYEEAIRAYKEAMRLAPGYSYIPYNLGLLYQRLNRRKDAEGAYRQAMALSPDLAEPYNALGFLNAAGGREAEAERFYRQALEKNADFLAARHNLAVLIAEKRDRGAEAVALWRENLSKSQDYLPSRLSLAETLARQGATAEAVQQYQTVLASKPDYTAARLALAELLVKSNRADEAIEQLREALKRKPRSAPAYEQMGDIEKARGRAAEAAAAYQKAAAYTADPKTRKRIRAKMKT